jgi:F0F1-type ATP synthase assembly protein I
MNEGDRPRDDSELTDLVRQQKVQLVAAYVVALVAPVPALVLFGSLAVGGPDLSLPIIGGIVLAVPCVYAVILARRFHAQKAERHRRVGAWMCIALSLVWPVCFFGCVWKVW